MRIPSALAALLILGAASAAHADPAKGKSLFREQCGLCHAAAPGDGEAGQGPDLAGVVVRKAGAEAGFGYTDAITKSGLTWSRDNLDKFLANPQAVVMGTSMPIAVGDAKDRQDLIDYLEGVTKK
jgi:cytochrome c2